MLKHTFLQPGVFVSQTKLPISSPKIVSAMDINIKKRKMKKKITQNLPASVLCSCSCSSVFSIICQAMLNYAVVTVEPRVVFVRTSRMTPFCMCVWLSWIWSICPSAVTVNCLPYIRTYFVSKNDNSKAWILHRSDTYTRRHLVSIFLWILSFFICTYTTTTTTLHYSRRPVCVYSS